MAPPMTKRRKLSHDEDSDSEGSFAGEEFSGFNASEGSDAEDAMEVVDVFPGEEGNFSENDGINNEEDDEGEDDASEGEEDDEDESGESANEPASSARVAVAKKAHKKPEAKLQDGIHTADTFKSNVFKLQVDELLAQVKPKYGKKEAPAENAMRTLKTLIEQLPSRAPLSVSEAEEVLRAEGVVIPFPSPLPPKDAKYKMQYERPSLVNATGSYPLKMATRTDDGLTIDLVVTMPKAIFQDKDYLNHRYFYKRAYYLACLAAGIEKSKENDFQISFDHLGGNQLQPIIVVRPSGNGNEADFSSSNCQINILLNVPEDTFPSAKLLPKSNCVRPRGNEEEGLNQPLTPTPFYNSTLQSDATITSYLKLLHATCGKSDAFRDACVLGRTWLRQRGFGSRLRKGGFGNFEWAAVTALLLQPNYGSGNTSFSSGYSSYQLFKATLQFLARHDLSQKPYTVQSSDASFPKSGLAPVFFDGSRSLNILFKMTPWSWSRLQLEAQITMDTLTDSLFDQFESTFILRTDSSLYRYDTTLELPLSANGLDSTNESYDEKLRQKCSKAYTALTRALTDRVTSIAFFMPDTGAWSISSPHAMENSRKRLLISFAINPANAHRTVDYGPTAENKQEAASFRKFWGDKSELRRFKDGSILESVVWSSKDSAASALEQIVLYILGRHISSEVGSKARFTTDSFSQLVPAGRIQGQSGVSAFTPIMTAFATVEKDIRALESLPLQVRHIRAADPQLRYTSIELPNLAPASIVLQFEASARWPDDLCAIQRTKIAFLLKISQLLSSAHKDIYTTRVGLENPSQPSQNQAFLDITVGSEFTFRLRIHHDREATLLERQLKDKSLDAQSRESAAVALSLHNRDSIRILSHTQAIQNLCTKFPVLSPSIRLTKRWFASHLISSHIPTEVIELLVVRTFLQPHPWPVPSCATTGFLRTLSWISRWDWRHVPLVIDFSSTITGSLTEHEGTVSSRMKPEDFDKMQTRFEAWRKIDPAMNRVVLFVATNLDTDGSTWTDRAKPEKVVAARMTALAKAATTALRAAEDRTLASVDGEDVKAIAFNPESLFVSQSQDFDFIVHISPKYTRATKKKSALKFKNIENQQRSQDRGNDEQGLVSFFIEDLCNIYGDAILFFYDFDTLDRIAGLWNPLVTGERAFKIKAGWNCTPIKSKKGKSEKKEDLGVDIQVNKGAIFNEIKRLGGDLVSEITTNR